MKKRILSFLLVFCLTMALLPINVLAVGNSYTINGHEVRASDIVQPYPGTMQCAEYATRVLQAIGKHIPGLTTYRGSYDILKELIEAGATAEERKITEDHVETFIQAAPIGSRIRVCASGGTTCCNNDNNGHGHTIVLVSKDNTAGSFTIFDSISKNGHKNSSNRIDDYYPREKTYTYQDFANEYKEKYFFYIASIDGIDYTSISPYFVCNVRIACFNGQRVNLYNYPGDASNVTYFDRGQISSSIRGLVRNDGTVWYQITANHNGTDRTFWLKYEAAKMTVTNMMPGGPYTLTPKCAPGARLDVSRASADDGANVQIYTANETTAQQWELTYLDNGYYKITSKASGKALDVAGASADAGANVQQYTPNGTNAQQWMLKDAGDGYYYIVPRVNTALCLDVAGAGAADGTNVGIFTANGTDAQKWKLTECSQIIQAGHTHAKGSASIVSMDTGSHPHYKFYTCATCGEVYTDSSTTYLSSCSICNPSKETGNSSTNSGNAESQNTGHWGPWSEWKNASYAGSDTREVESRRVEVRLATGHVVHSLQGRYRDWIPD